MERRILTCPGTPRPRTGQISLSNVVVVALTDGRVGALPLAPGQREFLPAVILDGNPSAHVSLAAYAGQIIAGTIGKRIVIGELGA